LKLKQIHISKPNKKRGLKVAFIIFSSALVLLVAGYFILKANMGKIETLITESLNEQVNGEVTIGDIDITIFNHFPHFSLSVKDVVVKDNRFNEHHLQIFSADRIYLQIRVFALLRKNIELRAITVKDGEINLMRMQDGLLNTKNLVKPKLKPEIPEEKDLDAILISRLYLENVHISFRDTVRGKDFDLTIKDSFGKLTHNSTITEITTKDKLFVKGLTFKPERGSCLTNKSINSRLRLEWNREKRIVEFRPSSLEMDKNKFSATGSISPGITPYLDLEVKTEKIKLDYATTLVSKYTSDKLKGFNFEKPIPAVLHIEGAINPALPLDIDIFFNVKDNAFITPSKSFEVDSLTGHYFNHLNDTLINNEINSGITFTDFKGKYEGIPFLMDMRVTDLTNPYMAVHVSSNFSLKEANDAIDTSVVLMTGGKLNFDVNFKGKAYGYLEKEKDSMDAAITGSAQISNASCRFPNKQFDLNSINGNISFNEKTMFVTALSMNINSNLVNVTGTISDFIYLFFFPDAKLQADAVVQTDNFNLDNFKKPGIAKQKQNIPQKRISKTVNSLLENLKGNITLNANKVTYHKLKAQQVSGKIILGNTYISCEELAATIAGGSFKINGNLSGLGTLQPTVKLKTNVRGANISDFFYQLENFNQKAITSTHLKGSLDAEITFNANLNKDLKPVPSSMSGQYDMTIKGGELVNMAALNQISKNVFKKKDFSDIQFAELNVSASQDGLDFQISEMQVKSNVMTLYVNGLYSFGENTELFIKVPIKSLNAKESDLITDFKNEDAKVGISVNLKATKVNGELKVAPVLFRKKDK